MKLRVAPGGLASELAAAEQSRADAIAAAEAQHGARRGDVIERGTRRVADLRRLEDEARAEREQVLPV